MLVFNEVVSYSLNHKKQGIPNDNDDDDNANSNKYNNS